MGSRNRHERAVCIQCGAFKPFALVQCASCGLVPVTPEDRARSFMLSESFDVGEETFGLSPAALRGAADEIARGGKFFFDPDMFAKVLAAYPVARSATSRKFIFDSLRWLLPPLFLLAVMFWLFAAFPSN